MFSQSLIMLGTFWFTVVPLLALGKGQLKTLDEATWPAVLEGEWMIEFFAPWCPACKQLEPLWKEFAEWSDDLGITVGNIDVTTNPGLSGRFMITALPTIYHVKDGVFRQYHGARDKDTFFNFIEEKKWTNIDPVSGWKSPNSWPMSTVSLFFKLSMTLRSYHNTMVEEYGLPYWGSYIIFGLATILVGAVLGLIIVCFLDFFCPTKPSGYQQFQGGETLQQETEAEGEYEGEDVIKDDSPGVADSELRQRKETTKE